MSAEISQAAQDARQRLHEEIDRVRLGVEEMLDDQENGNGNGLGSHGDSSDVRRELEELRLETRNYVKKRVRKSEKKLERSVRELDARTEKLQRRIDEVAAEREASEARIHQDTEKMLDGLLGDVRSIADRLTGMPAPAARPQPAPARPAKAPLPAPAKAAQPAKPAAPAAKPAEPQRPAAAPKGPVGRIGPPIRRAG